jgi:hypothetical protein
MTAASAFPSPIDPFGPVASAIYIDARGTHIPAFYVRNPHREPDKVIVKQNGIPLIGAGGETFTVSWVAPERRWAIDPEGELLGQNEFNATFLQTVLEYYEVLRANGHPNAAFKGDLNLHPQPAVQDYVSLCIDPEDESKLSHIGYDPHSTGEQPERFYDTDGEEIAGARIDHLCAAYADPKLRVTLTEVEVAEVRSRLGVAADDMSELATKLELLNSMLSDGTITMEQHSVQVSALTGKVVVAQADKPVITPDPAPAEEKPVLVTALCGKEVRGKTAQTANFGKRAHERRCGKCEALTPAEEDSS